MAVRARAPHVPQRALSLCHSRRLRTQSPPYVIERRRFFLSPESPNRIFHTVSTFREGSGAIPSALAGIVGPRLGSSADGAAAPAPKGWGCRGDAPSSAAVASTSGAGGSAAADGTPAPQMYQMSHNEARANAPRHRCVVAPPARPTGSCQQRSSIALVCWSVTGVAGVPGGASGLPSSLLRVSVLPGARLAGAPFPLSCRPQQLPVLEAHLESSAPPLHPSFALRRSAAGCSMGLISSSTRAIRRW